jgi:hypothetical protein
MVAPEIAIESQTWRPIFEKCPHLREKGGGAHQNLRSWVIACPVQYSVVVNLARFGPNFGKF